MVKELIFYILDIPETKNKETITSAYRTNLKKHNPEDDPEGFKRLRQAYEAALDFANQTDEDLEEANRFPMAYQTPQHKKHNKNDNPEEVAMDLWMSRIIKVYEDLTLRRDEEEWKSILNDPICQDLDTSLEAQNRIMNFFTDAFHLPHNIWALVDQTFQIKKNQETLKEYYPPKFLNYICYYIENEDFLPFALFEYTNENEKNTNADSYIELLLSLQKQADARLLDHCRETLENIKAYGIYHPFEDVGRLRLYIYEESPEKIPDLLDSLYPRYKDYDYISLYVGEGRWLLGDIEGAYEIWSHILENDPNFYAAKYNKLRYLCEKKDFYNAIHIYSGYFGPYLFAMEVFYIYKQYEDAKKIIDLANENHVDFSPKMRLYEAKVLRNLAHENQERAKIELLLLKLQKELNKEGCDIEDKSEVNLELCFINWDCNKYEQALKYLNNAKKQKPDNPYFDYIHALILCDKSNFIGALKLFSKIEKDYENNPAFCYNKGLCLECLDNMVSAIEYYQKTLEIEEVFDDACEKISDYYFDKYKETYDKKYYELSISYISRQLKVAENCYYLVHRGLLYMNAYDLDLAIKDFEAALSYRPNDWAAWNNLGCCYKYLGDYEKAIYHLEKAAEYMCETDQISALPYGNMADCYEICQDYEKSLACYMKNLEYFPDALYNWEEIGDLYVYMGRIEEALEAYSHMNNPINYAQCVGAIWMNKGNQRKCLKAFRKLLNTSDKPTLTQAHKRIGLLFLEYVRDYKKTISYLKKALKFCDNPKTSMNIATNIAKCYYMLGSNKKSEKYANLALQYLHAHTTATVEEFVSYKPTAPYELIDIAWIYICLGQKEVGLNYLERITTLHPCKGCRHKKCFERDLALGYFYESQKDIQKALYHYKEVLKVNTHDTTAKLAIATLQKNNK